MHVPIACSIDSLIAAAAMAYGGCPEVYQRRAIFAFMACDLVAGVAGASLGITVSTAAALVGLAVGAALLAPARKWPLLYLAVPILLSMDNLALGAADAPASLPAAVLDGLCSGGLAWAGFAVARMVRASRDYRHGGIA